MNQDVVKLHVAVHDPQSVERRAPGYDLSDALFSDLFREALFCVEHRLQRAAICILKDAVVVAASADDLLKTNHMTAVDDLKKDKLAAQRQHPFLPVA